MRGTLLNAACACHLYHARYAPIAKQYSLLFRVRLDIQSRETRLVYAIIEPNVMLVCLLSRKKVYKDLEKYLSKLK
ncbi:hypothetical protein COV93_02705 [Candidatus Woesearchaeota archaeon CG11_big_fil_rev_8_21_14_0_20_43_8]|nr:MAG: hypothetical protein COV93_02705 [Candidatus Woesearchaeota archaeon CG11_big_fil_rev_8_21_14_0_20_43_8]